MLYIICAELQCRLNAPIEISFRSDAFLLFFSEESVVEFSTPNIITVNLETFITSLTSARGNVV